MSKKLIAFVPLMVMLFASLAEAQQIPSGLSYLNPPSSLVGGLPSPSASPTPGTLETVTDDTISSCNFDSAPVGSGGSSCLVYFDGTTLAWVHAFPPDITPPTTIDVRTGTGGGYVDSNGTCKQGTSTAGCATGQALWVVNAGTTSASNFTVSGTFVDQIGNTQNLTTWGGSGVVGWNYDIWQTNGSYSASGNNPVYNGCHASGTIASVTNSTTFVANTPTSKTGSNCSTDLFNSTTATVTIWDGKDDVALYAAAQQAGTNASAYNTGSVVYLPSGFYHLQTDSYLGGANQFPANIKFQCQSPQTTYVIMTDVSTNTNDIISPGNHNIITNCTFTMTNTANNVDYFGRGNGGGWIGIAGGTYDVTITNNNFIDSWSDTGIPVQFGTTTTNSAPCGPGNGVNSAGKCVTMPQGIFIDHNYFADCADRATQISGGIDVHFENNKLLDCDIGFNFNISTNTSPSLFSGNEAKNNDLHCDSVGNGMFVGATAIGKTPQLPGAGNGCWLVLDDDGFNSLNLSYSAAEMNHMRADTASPAAACWWGSSGTAVSPLIRGNTCTTGEHCSNNGGC